jgi:hypothetical protein
LLLTRRSTAPGRILPVSTRLPASVSIISDRVRRSDKPVERAAYTYESHIAWAGEWLDQLGLTGITLFGQL